VAFSSNWRRPYQGWNQHPIVHFQRSILQPTRIEARNNKKNSKRRKHTTQYDRRSHGRAIRHHHKEVVAHKNESTKWVGSTGSISAASSASGHFTKSLHNTVERTLQRGSFSRRPYARNRALHWRSFVIGLPSRNAPGWYSGMARSCCITNCLNLSSRRLRILLLATRIYCRPNFYRGTYIVGPSKAAPGAPLHCHPQGLSVILHPLVTSARPLP
jgi:hypothetical protein